MKKDQGFLPRSSRVLLKYLRLEIYKSVTFVMVAFVGLFAFFDLIAEVDRLSQSNTSWFYYFISVILGLPSKVYEIAPIAALIGSIYALVQLASTSQFTAMRAAGLGTLGVIWIMARIALGIVVISVLFGEVVAPIAEKAAVPMRAAALGYEVERDFRSGYWIRDAFVSASGQTKVRFVNFKNFDNDGRLLNIEFYEFAENLQLMRWVRAQEASYDQTHAHWVLSGVTTQRFSSESNWDGLIPNHGQDVFASGLITMHELNWRSSLSPNLLTGLFVRPERMSAVQLYNYSQFLKSNLQATQNIDLAFAKKVIYPLAIFVMVLISLSFAYLQFRSGGVSVKVFIGVMIGIGFHLSNNLFSHLSVVANYPPFVSASIPALVGLVVGLGSLWWVSRPTPIRTLKRLLSAAKMPINT